MVWGLGDHLSVTVTLAHHHFLSLEPPHCTPVPHPPRASGHIFLSQLSSPQLSTTIWLRLYFREFFLFANQNILYTLQNWYLPSTNTPALRWELCVCVCEREDACVVTCVAFSRPAFTAQLCPFVVVWLWAILSFLICKKGEPQQLLLWDETALVHTEHRAPQEYALGLSSC